MSTILVEGFLKIRGSFTDYDDDDDDDAVTSLSSAWVIMLVIDW